MEWDHIWGWFDNKHKNKGLFMRKDEKHNQLLKISCTFEEKKNFFFSNKKFDIKSLCELNIL